MADGDVLYIPSIRMDFSMIERFSISHGVDLGKKQKKSMIDIAENRPVEAKKAFA